MTAVDYRVEIDIFSGPLDLLLYLVRRNEVDVIDLPIAKIAAHFMDYLEILEFLDLDLIGDFLVMASTLIEIKSRMVLPRPEEAEVEETDVEEDPRGELIQQLLEYKKFKDAASALEERAAEWQERFPRLSDERPLTGKDHAADPIKEVELWDLVSALARVVRQKEIEEETCIEYDDTPISVYVERMRARIIAEGKVTFSSCFEGTNFRSKIIGIFLAVLELLRHHHYRADQPTDFGDIWIYPPVEPPAEEEPARDEQVAEEQPAENAAADTTADGTTADAGDEHPADDEK